MKLLGTERFRMAEGDAALGGDPAPTAAQSDMDILNDETSPEETDEGPGGGEEEKEIEGGEEEEVEETDTDEATDEEDEEDEELEDPDEEKEEKEEPEEKEEKAPKLASALAKGLKAKHPTIFKDFPELRKTLFEHQAIKEVIETPEQARELVQKSQDFDEYERHVMNGDPRLLLNALAETGTEVFEKFVVNILPVAAKMSPTIQNRVLAPYITRVLRNAQEDGKAAGNKNLFLATKYISRYLFGKDDLPSETPSTPPVERKGPSPEVLRLMAENNALKGKNLEDFSDSVRSEGLGQFTKEVEKTFSKELKDKTFSPIEVEALVEKIVTGVRARLDSDTEHKKRMGALWMQANAAGHTKDSVPRLVNAFLGGAKGLLPAVRARVVNEALRKKGITLPSKGKIPGVPKTGGPARKDTVISSKNIDYRRTSDEAILGDDPSKIILRKGV